MGFIERFFSSWFGRSEAVRRHGFGRSEAVRRRGFGRSEAVPRCGFEPSDAVRRRGPLQSRGEVDAEVAAVLRDGAGPQTSEA